MNTVVRSSNIHGKGLFALKSFAVGDVVEEIDYEIVLRESRSKYAMRLSGARSAIIKNKTKYVNGSHEPNVRFDLARGLIATRAITPNEELTSEYASVFSAC